MLGINKIGRGIISPPNFCNDIFSFYKINLCDFLKGVNPMLFVKVFYAETERELNEMIMKFLTEILENPIKDYEHSSYEKCYRRMKRIRVFPHTGSHGTLTGYSAVLQYSYDSVVVPWMEAIKAFEKI